MIAASQPVNKNVSTGAMARLHWRQIPSRDHKLSPSAGDDN